MIDILTNGFLMSPVPIQLTGNYCSHNCSYCFANLNNPKRKINFKGLASQLKNFKKRNDLPSIYMRGGYPVLISNNIDPFSKSNQPFINEIILTLQDLNIPVVLATRGGEGWEKIKDNITPSVWYITIPYDTDKKRAQYEKNAPPIEERWDMIESVINAGHKVILSINPLNRAFCDDPLLLAERAVKNGVKSILINRLHLSASQKKNMTDRQRESMGGELLEESSKKGFTDDWIYDAILLKSYCDEHDVNLIGVDTGLKNNYYSEFAQCYSNLLPTIYNFFTWCYDNKKEGDLISFNDFFSFFSPLLPVIEGNISKYIFNKAVIDDKEYYKKMSIKNLLFLYWQHHKIEIGLAKYYPSFSWVKKVQVDKIDYLRDSDGNQLLYYNKDNFNHATNIIVNEKSFA